MTRSSARSSLAPAARFLLAAISALLLPLSALQAQYQFGPNIQYQSFGKNKVQYRDFKWETYHSPHFTIYYYEAEQGSLQKVVSFAESAYDELARALNYQIKDPVPLIYFATHSAFEQNNVILDFIEEGIGAFASPARTRMVLPIDLPDARLITLIRHELTHVFQYKMLYGGSLAKALAAGQPLWFIEGMASYFGRDETPRDKMFLRDAVVNDRLPSVKLNFQGFFAYRFGHAVFDFINERWGHEGLLDFLYETRNTISGKIERSIKRAFKMEADEFDIEFRRWARRKYLVQLVETGEPSDYGRVFRIKEETNTFNLSPTASPSGDLVASFSAYRDKVDVVLFDARKRTFIRNLTKGYSDRYQYLVAQELQIGRGFGRDIAFSPDGNLIAVFAKRERGRSLLLLDALNGGINRIIDMPDVEQQLAPAWSPDGKKVAFSGWRNNQFDIFVLDLDTQTITNLTNDELFDGAPAFAPDGKSIVFVSVVGAGGYAKLFRMDLDTKQRVQLTTGESNENDPIFSSDGKRLYFTSDRPTLQGQAKVAERENIYSLELASGELRQYTNVVTGAFMPTVLRDPAAGEKLVFTGFWKGTFDLYETPVNEPVAKGTVAIASGPASGGELPRFEPDIQVSVDPANKDRYHGRKFFLEDAGSYFGVASDQTYIGRVVLSFSDYLGNQRIIADLSTINSFSNFDFIYANLAHRLQWQVRLFDDRTFYFTQDLTTGRIHQRTAYQQTGAVGSLILPFSFYDRAEIGAGFIHRTIGFQDFVVSNTGQPIPTVVPSSDNFPVVEGALVGDSAQFAYWGPIAGRRWRLDGLYAPQIQGGGGTLYTSASLDARQYIPVTLRSNLALRAFGGIADGKRPSPFFFGGLDTVRGFRFRDLTGDRAFFANIEYRFPLIDVLATPVLGFRGIRGNVFFDVGGAWFKNFQTFRFYNSKTHTLQDAVSAYGWGFTINLLGLEVNWDFARQWDFKKASNFRSDFWIGARF